MAFEQDLQRLEEIAEKLGEEDITVDGSIELFRSGIEHFESALKALSEGRGKVTVLKEQLDKLLKDGDV